MALEIDLRLNKPQLQAQQILFKPDGSVNRGVTVFLGWGRGVGKALALDTELPTPSGWTTMGEVAVGDLLLDERGKPCRVTNVTDVMLDRECFAVEFDDGSVIVADAEHQWLTWDKAARKAHGRKKKPRFHPQVRTTREIVGSLCVQNGRETNHSIPVAQPLDLPDAILPIDPYALGAWLGDGTSSAGSITIGHEDVEELGEQLAASGYPLAAPMRSAFRENSALYTVAKGRDSLQGKLRAAGLLGNKHVPQIYLRSSERQRRRLLAGLLDTDGCCNEGGLVEFTSTSRRLADGVFELAASLGFKPFLSEGRAKLNGKDCGAKYRVTFTPRESVFGLSRKNARIRTDRAQRNRTKHRYIVNAKPVPSVPVKCITVDSSSHLFLAGRAMIPTHNSWYRRQVWWLLVAAFEFKLRQEALEPFRGVRITSLAPTLKQWKDIHWTGVIEELTGDGKWSWLNAKLDAQSGQIRFPGGSIVRPFPASAYNARTARGMRTDVLDADEVDDIDASVYDGVAVPWLSEPWSLQIELPGGTPTRGRHGLFWRNLAAGRLGQKLREGIPPEELLSEEDIERYRSLSDDEDAGLEQVVDALKSIYAIHATYRDAPETVSKRAVARAMATTPQATFKREWEADPDAGEGLVYPFDERVHVAEPPPLNSFREFHVGMDHGWADAGVLLLGGIQGHGNDAVLWLLDEWYERECPNHIWNERAAAWSFAKFWPDPSRPDRIADLRGMGIQVGETDNNILGGIARVAELMFVRQTEEGERYARLYVAPKCKNTIREFGLYRRKKLPDGSFDEMPEDKNNHAMDAGRYMTVGRFGRAPNYKTITSGR